MSNIKFGHYLYVINFQDYEESLCYLEMKSLFQESINEKYFFSDKNIDPSRSPFIKYRISISFTTSTIPDLQNTLKRNCVTFKKYKFEYSNVENNEIDFSKWTKIVSELSSCINGIMDLDDPCTLLSIVKVDEVWFFGEYCKNDNKWKFHDYKPNTNSHSLGIRTAKSLVNIAVGVEKNLTLIDPCCGMGTVVIEAISMGMNVKGYEINWKIAEKAKENLLFFGIDEIITHVDMHKTEEHFDVSIIDIPYGLFTPITIEEQKNIIITARRISHKMVIITFENMEKLITEAGFNIIDCCQVNKGKFTRYISVCM